MTEKPTFLLVLASEERIRDYMLCLTTFSLFEDTSPITMHFSFVDNYVPKSWYIRKNKAGVTIYYWES